MKFKLYEKLMRESCKFGEDVFPYLRIEIVFGWKFIFFFIVSVCDKSFCHRNIFTALCRALESETVASAKYVRAKDLITKINHD
jgi:hypothetical protein